MDNSYSYEERQWYEKDTPDRYAYNQCLVDFWRYPHFAHRRRELTWINKCG